MASKTNTTTQDFLDIYDITNNILLLKDGSASMIVTINAMNFGLLAEQEQDAIIYTYAALLNSLNYPIQILIQSQTKDASKYLDLLIEQEKTASPQKKQLISRYRQFVANLIRERNVLDKKFYVVISASALEMGLLSTASVLPGASQTDISTVEKSIILDRARTILEPRRDHIMGQFGRIGLIARQLSTQEIIRVFYTNYNPEAVEGQQMTDSDQYTTPIIQASTMGGFMNNQQMAGTPPAAPTQPAAPAPVAPASGAPATPVQQQATPPVQPVAPAAAPAPTATMQQPIVMAEPAIATPQPVQQPVQQPVAPMATPQIAPTESIQETVTPMADTSTTPDMPIQATSPEVTTPVVSTPSPELAPDSTIPVTPVAVAEDNAQQAIEETLKQISPDMIAPAPAEQSPVDPATKETPVPTQGDGSLPPLPEI